MIFVPFKVIRIACSSSFKRFNGTCTFQVLYSESNIFVAEVPICDKHFRG